MSLQQLTTINRLLVLSFAFALFALSFSFWAELIWKIVPCRLCQFQRLFFFVVLILSAFSFFKEDKHLPVLFLRITFLALALLAGYHLLVQFQIVPDPCAVPQNIKTIADFKMMLITQHTPCAAKSLTLFSIPAAAYNMIFAILFATMLPTQKFKLRNLH